MKTKCDHPLTSVCAKCVDTKVKNDQAAREATAAAREATLPMWAQVTLRGLRMQIDRMREVLTKVPDGRIAIGPHGRHEDPLLLAGDLRVDFAADYIKPHKGRFHFQVWLGNDGESLEVNASDRIYFETSASNTLTIRQRP